MKTNHTHTQNSDNSLTELAIINQPNDKGTMSSREIAEMYEKNHKDVLRKIRSLEDPYIAAFGNERKFALVEYQDAKGELRPEILLNKSQALFVASRFDAVLHARVQKRWEELEQKAQQPAFDPMKALNDPTIIRGLLLNYSEKVLVLEDTLAKQQPKVEAFDRIAGTDGETCITVTAKALQMRPKDLFQFMSFHKWIYRRLGGKGWVAYQDKIQQGLLTHKVTTVSTSDGREKTVEQVLVTSKGLARLSTMAHTIN